MIGRVRITFAILLAAVAAHHASADEAPVLRAGAFAMDITPEKLPVLVNGGMYSRTADKVVDRLHARCLVLDDGTETIAIVVVDSCGVPRAIADEAKAIAAKATGIAENRMLISATHTHSAPSVWGGLGTDGDEAYAKFLPGRIARGIALAHENLEPARIGWGSARDPKNVFCRRYLMKEGTARTNPFSGKSNDRAQMNPGHANPNKIKRTGPVDDEVSVVSVQSRDGRPIALLANYSTHYAGAPALSADYFGVFAENMTKHLKAENAKPAFVGIMSNGTSGDANCFDFELGKRRGFNRFTVAEDTAAAALEAYQEIKYYNWVPVVMAEEVLTVDVRMPTDEEVAKAKAFLQTKEGKSLRTIPAVYARETVLLSGMPPTRDLKLQVIRLGELGITAIPNEVYGITGLTIKKESPLQPTFNISLANGSFGYIAPPDQHKLGGYTTWRARSSCLEEHAEPKIRAKVLELLKQVAQERMDEELQAAVNKRHPLFALLFPRKSDPPAASTVARPVARTESVLARRVPTPGGPASAAPPSQPVVVLERTEVARQSSPASVPRAEVGPPLVRRKTTEELRQMRFGDPPLEIATAVVSLAAASTPRDVPSPLSPENSLDYLHVRPGMVVELVAAEPLVRDPIAFDWGPDGRLWVVEMLDYPTGIDGKGKPGGRVSYLEDTDEDGRYDKSTVFVDGLNFPMGVMAWRDGVLITAAPDILHARDTDDDGKADKVEKLYTGFYEGNQQLRMNGLRWGLDNWIYCAGGSAAGTTGKPGKITSVKTGDTIDLAGGDFRIKPDEGLIEPLSGWSQFGRNRDDWGNWFGCQNAKPMFHFVLEERYLKRNPYVTYPDPKVLISDVPGQRPVFPKSKPGKFFHESQAGRFTSACSAIIYRDELLGKEFRGNSFVCEPVHNLVHREIVQRHGVTFRSHKPKDEEQTEFLASEDPWFRPVMIRTGPDGALWLADMYRESVEHPRWVKDELKPLVDTRNGTNHGRIYRIYSKGTPPRKVPRIEKLSADELTEMLECPNGTLRDIVHRKLVTLKVEDRVSQRLWQLAVGPADFETRHQAIGVLYGLDLAPAELFKHWATLPRNPEEVATLTRYQVPEYDEILGDWIKGRAIGGRPDRQFSLQAALALGELDYDDAGDVLVLIALTFQDDPMVVAAAMSSLCDNNKVDRALKQFVAHRWPTADPSTEVLAPLVDTAIGFERWERLADLVEFLASEQEGGYEVWQLTGLAHSYRKLSRLMKPPHQRLNFNHKESESGKRLAQATQFARKALRGESASLKMQLAAIDLITAIGMSREDRNLLAGLLSPRLDSQLQSTAIEALARTGQAEVPAMLLQRWPEYGPNMRGQVLDALISRNAWCKLLLSRIEAGDLHPRDLDATRRERLLKSRDPEIRGLAANVLRAETQTDVAELLARYRLAIDSPTTLPSAALGKSVFKQRCASCHRLGGEGQQVGPDLKGLTDKSAGFLLTSILDPNRAVDPRYVSYNATTTRGRQFSGMIQSEAGGSVTLLSAEGKTHALLRRDLEEFTASGKSLMPEGLHRDITPAQMADLLRYLEKELVGQALP